MSIENEVSGLKGRVSYLEGQVEYLTAVVKCGGLRVSVLHRRCKPKTMKVLALTGGKCFYCKTELNGVWTSDHLIPLAKGGSNRLTNLVPACDPCNSRKANRMPTNQEVELATHLHMKAKL